MEPLPQAAPNRAWAWFARLPRSAIGRLIISVAVMGVTVFALAVAAKWPPLGWLTRSPAFLALGALSGLAFGVRVLERKALTQEGLFPWESLAQVGAGFGVGAGLSLATVVAIALLGGGTLSRVAQISASALVLSFVLVAVGALWEEVVFRGLLLRLLNQALGPVVAVVASSALFGFAHAQNPSATLTSSLAIALEAGALLSAAWFLGRSLWLPLGLHAGWNFTQSHLLGASTSGHVASNSLLQFSPTGSPLLTGGTFGPEASLVAVLICGAASVGFFAWVWKRARTSALPQP